LQQAQKNCPDAQTGDRAQQPAQVVARRATDGIAERTLEPAAIHAVISLQVSNGRLDGLPPA